MSIIGKSLTTLGSGGLKSQIVVTAPTGSTVTCTTPGGIVMTTTEVSGTWTFDNLSTLGTYVVTATLGSQTKTQNVLIDSTGVYNVTIEYKLYLYSEGDECTSVTGGFVESGTKDNWAAGYISALPIDTSGYTKIYATFTPSYGGSQENYGFFARFSDSTLTNRGISILDATDTANVEITRSANIDSFYDYLTVLAVENALGVTGLIREKRSSSLYVKKSELGGQYWCSVEIKRIWLE